MVDVVDVVDVPDDPPVTHDLVLSSQIAGSKKYEDPNWTLYFDPLEWLCILFNQCSHLIDSE